MIGYNSNDMDTLKEALRALVETTAESDREAQLIALFHEVYVTGPI